MDRSKLGKLRRYCVSGNIFAVAGVAAAAVFMLLVHADRITVGEIAVIIAAAVILGAGLYMAGAISVGKTFDKRCEELRKKGMLAPALTDLEYADKAFRGKIAFGKYAFAIKGYGLVYPYSEVENMYLPDASESSGVRKIHIVVEGKDMAILEVSEKNTADAQQAVELFMQRKSMS